VIQGEQHETLDRVICIADYWIHGRNESAHVNSPIIRIHSDRKWPERIVFDTTPPTIVPATTAIVEDRVPSPVTVAHVAIKEREREAFALMQPSNAKRLEPSAPGRRELKPQRQRKIVKRHEMPRSLFVARQPQFGWFGNTIW
jgi:hypothetical protein